MKKGCAYKTELANEYGVDLDTLKKEIELNIPKMSKEDLKTLGKWKGKGYLWPKQIAVIKKYLGDFE